MKPLRVLPWLLLLTVSAFARPELPAPRAVLGFEPGDDRKLADWSQITAYFQRLDAASDRVVVRQLGKTTLGKPFLLALISAPENLRDLKKYQDIQRRLADPRRLQSFTEAVELIRQAKNVVAISCSIHATEIVASQMSMTLAYTLAREESAEMRDLLANTIILLLPSMNPDGTDIVVNWYRQTLGTNAEGSAPPELYHHYAGHDNNRDWYMLNLAETRLVTDLFYQEWFPHVVYDVHQMGEYTARMFVPPFLDPPNPNIDPVILREVGLLGAKMAADLQAAGFRGVATNMLYDTWWHGGMRTAPYYHNTVGILSEAASAQLATPINITREELVRGGPGQSDDLRASRSRSRAVRGLDNPLQRATNFPDPWPGGVWRPRDILNMELTATRSLLGFVTKYREEFIRNFYEAGRRAIAAGENEAPFAYVIPAAQHDPFAARKMISVLAAQGVEVHEAREAFTAAGVRYPAGSRVVLMRQPYRACAKALLEIQQYPERRLFPGGPAERPYDVAGWTLPLQMGVNCVEAREKFNARLQLLGDAALREEARIDHPRADVRARVGLYQSYVANMDEGWTRYVFDEWQLAYTTLRDADMRAGVLRDKYDVIVLPDQRAREITQGLSDRIYPARYSGGLGTAGVAALREFVQAGGTVLCFDNAAGFAIEAFALPLRNALASLGAADFYGPGSLLRVELDAKHAISRGMPAAVDAYFTNSAAFEITDRAQAVEIARYAQRDVLRSGWLLGEKFLAGKTAIAEARYGKGRLILFGFRPQHRAQTWGTFRLIFNAMRHATESGAQ
ncbi:MAG: M14 family zinc carboxypeptidase [Blastocatellia bacterium]